MDKNKLLNNIDELLLNPSMKHVEPCVGQIGHARMFINHKAINRDARTIDFICSTGQIDRYGEIVEPSAFANSLDSFMKNPVFPYGHTYTAIGQTLPTVGHWKTVATTKDALVGTAWFKPRGLGEECWQDYLDGNLTSVSVGFISNAWEMREVEVSKNVLKRVRVFTDVDLIEISSVLIPANTQARLRAAAFAADNNNPILEQVLKRLEGLEESIADRDSFMRFMQEDDDTDMQRGFADYSVDYFGDNIPDADNVPAPRSASLGDDSDNELKKHLRDLLAASR